MVMSRRILKGEEVDESDQTAEVLADLDVKELPSIELNLPPPPAGINANIAAPTPQPIAAPLVEESANVAAEESRGAPPLPPSGLPDGWSQDQWESFGWQYLDALNG